jgi:hypothetical protein
MTQRKAKELKCGDVFRLAICGEVLAATPVAEGKRIRVRLAIEDQGHRSYGGSANFDRSSSLEFLDSGCFLEFVCRPGRTFQLLAWDDDPSGRLGDGPALPLSPDGRRASKRTPISKHSVVPTT